MKKRLIPLALVGLALVGCASQGDYYAAIQHANETQVKATEARARADAARYEAMARVAETGDASTKTAIAMALAFSGGQGAAGSTPLAVPQPLRSEALEWASILAPSVTQIGLRLADRDVQMHQATMQRDIAVSTNATFGSLGLSIERAGTAGYPFVQAPGAVTTTSTSTTTTYSDSYNQDSTHEPTVVYPQQSVQ